jgi:hypothetical protein
VAHVGGSGASLAQRYKRLEGRPFRACESRKRKPPGEKSFSSFSTAIDY